MDKYGHIWYQIKAYPANKKKRLSYILIGNVFKQTLSKRVFLRFEYFLLPRTQDIHVEIMTINDEDCSVHFYDAPMQHGRVA